MATQVIVKSEEDMIMDRYIAFCAEVDARENTTTVEPTTTIATPTTVIESTTTTTTPTTTATLTSTTSVAEDEEMTDATSYEDSSEEDSSDEDCTTDEEDCSEYEESSNDADEDENPASNDKDHMEYEEPISDADDDEKPPVQDDSEFTTEQLVADYFEWYAFEDAMENKKLVSYPKHPSQFLNLCINEGTLTYLCMFFHIQLYPVQWFISPEFNKTMDDILRVWAKMGFDQGCHTHIDIDSRSFARFNKMKNMEWSLLEEHIPKESYFTWNSRYHTTNPTPPTNRTWSFMDYVIDMAAELDIEGLVNVQKFYRKLRLFMRFMIDGPSVGTWIGISNSKSNPIQIFTVQFGFLSLSFIWISKTNTRTFCLVRQ